MNDVAQLGTILGIWAHPDDETFCAGGLLAQAAANGQTIVNVTATRGEGGIQNETRWPAEKLASIRTAELKTAFEILGIPVQVWLDYPDGGCADIGDEAAIARLQEVIDRVKPDSIVSFGAEGLTGHPDHAAVSRWASRAAGDIPVFQVVQDAKQYQKYLKSLDKKFNVYFNIDQPPLRDAADCDIALKLTPDVLKKKLDALAAMPSQYDAMFKGLSGEQLGHMFDTECFVRSGAREHQKSL